MAAEGESSVVHRDLRPDVLVTTDAGAVCDCLSRGEASAIPEGSDRCNICGKLADPKVVEWVAELREGIRAHEAGEPSSFKIHPMPTIKPEGRATEVVVHAHGDGQECTAECATGWLPMSGDAPKDGPNEFAFAIIGHKHGEGEPCTAGCTVNRVVAGTQ
jgi:hypothetical protein